MKISELINALNRVLKENGDLELLVYDAEGDTNSHINLTIYTEGVALLIEGEL